MSFIGVKLFVAVMVAVITVQGTYLGYVVGVLTSIERRFEISSRKSGSLLSLYDIGHMLSVLFVGYFGSHGHKPRITAFGKLSIRIWQFGNTHVCIIFANN